MKSIFTILFFSLFLINCQKETKDTFIEVRIEHNSTWNTDKGFAIFEINDYYKNGNEAEILDCPYTLEDDIITYNVKDFLDSKSIYTTFAIRGKLGHQITNGYRWKYETIKSTIKEGQFIEEVINFE